MLLLLQLGHVLVTPASVEALAEPAVEFGVVLFVIEGPSTEKEFQEIDVSRVKLREGCCVLSQAGDVQPSKPTHDSYTHTHYWWLCLDGEVRADLLLPEPDTRSPGHVLG